MYPNNSLFAVLRGNIREWIVALTLLTGAAVYVGNAWTPSSYAIVMNMFGMDQVHPTLGTPRGVRSDEYFVQTPYFQMAVRSHLQNHETVSPYSEPMKNFMAYPTKDWSIVFKPALWGFLVLPPAYAYSFYFCLLSLSTLLGWFVFLRSLRVPTAIAAAGALTLLFSHFFQVWWTTNAPAFAYAPWVAVAFVVPRKEWQRFLAVFCTITVWAFGLLYPPFLYAIGIAMILAVAALRPDTFRIRSLTSSIIAAVAAGLVIYLYMHNIIDVMRSTVYPGQRSLDGGTTPWVQVLSTIFPYFNIIIFDPTLLAPLTRNECEVGALSSYLFVLIACFTTRSSLRAFIAENRRTVAVVATGLFGMCAWMILPIPSAVGHLLLLDKIPPTRLIVGFGLLLHIFLFFLISKLQISITARRVAVFAAIVVGITLIRKWHLPSGTLEECWFDISAAALMILAYLYVRWQTPILSPSALLVSVAALTNIITFGTFNPLQSAKPFFKDYSSGTIGQLRELQTTSGNGSVVLPGWYGAALNGLGISSINDTLISPRQTIFSQTFPSLSPDEVNELFNRYGHVIPEFIEKPYSSGDQIFVPIQAFLTKGRIKRDAIISTSSTTGTLSNYSILHKTNGRYEIEITGWANFAGVDPMQQILFNTDEWEPLGIIRTMRPDVVNAYHDPKLALSGFQAYWSTDNGQLPPGLRLASFDPKYGTRSFSDLLALSILNQRPIAPAVIGGKGFIDELRFNSSNGVLHVRGWLPYPPQAWQEIRIVLPSGKFLSASLNRSERPDLASKFGPKWRYAGFDLNVQFDSKIAPDLSKICVVAFDSTKGAAQFHVTGGTSCPGHQ